MEQNFFLVGDAGRCGDERSGCFLWPRRSLLEIWALQNHSVVLVGGTRHRCGPFSCRSQNLAKKFSYQQRGTNFKRSPSWTSLFPSDSVLALALGGEQRAYPLRVLMQYPVINDVLGGVSITVSYSPFCDTFWVFERTWKGQPTRFNLSRRLQQGCLLLRDEATHSWWSQGWGRAIAGPRLDESPAPLLAYRTTLKHWRQIYPHTTVVTPLQSLRTWWGHYATMSELAYPAKHQEKLNLHPKESVVFALPNGDAQDVGPGLELRRLIFKGQVWQEAHGEKIMVVWDPSLQTARFYRADGKEIPGGSAYAFAYVGLFDQAING